MLQINRESAFRHHQLDNWVRAEKYISGRVVDLGGKTKPNIHLVLPSNESLKIEAGESQLQGADYLYKAITLNVTAMEHIRTGELRDLRHQFCGTIPVRFIRRRWTTSGTGWRTDTCSAFPPWSYRSLKSANRRAIFRCNISIISSECGCRCC